MYLSPLFQELYESSPRLKNIFPHGVENEVWSPRSTARLDVNTIQNLLRAEHERLGLKAWSAELDAHFKADTQFILTGQQAVFAGGPFLIWEKAKTCVEWARFYRNQGYSCLPIFWIAGDDSDAAEVLHFEWTAKTLAVPSLAQKGMVGTWELTPDWLQEIEAWAQEVGFPVDLTQFYQTGGTWVSAFAQIIQSWFGNEILILDGSSPLLQSYKDEFFATWIPQAEQISALLGQREAELRSMNIKIQIPHTGGLRFFHTDGIERARPEKQRWENPHFTHDALSRPLFIDAHFPIRSHVLGPGELQYFAQLSGLYEYLAIPFPKLITRIHTRVQRTELTNLLSKWDLSLAEVLNFSLSDWAKHLFHQESPFKLDQPWIFIEGHHPLWIQQVTKLDQKFARIWQKEQHQFVLNFAKSHSDWPVINREWRFMGSGRPQDRILSYFELAQFVPQLETKIAARLPELQWIYLED